MSHDESRITSVKATPYAVPVTVPYAETEFQLPLVLTTITTGDGLSGSGMATGPGTATTMADFINQVVSKDLVGQSLDGHAKTWNTLHNKYNNWLHTGFWSSVQSAVDVAMWDVRGKQLGESIAALLGGSRARVPAYITFGTSEHSVESLIAFARELVEAGHTALKMVVGGAKHPRAGAEGMAVDDRRSLRAVERDAERVLAVREAIGPDIDLMIDANCRLSFLDAVRLCGYLEGSHLAWFEEPLVGNDPSLLSQLRDRTSVPIAAGQRIGHVWGHRQLIEQGSIDICQPNVVNCGGFTEGQQIAALARAFNLPLGHGGAWPHHNLHLHAGVSNGGYVEYHWIAWKTGEALYDDPPSCEGGFAEVPSKPGLGFDPRSEEELDRYVVRAN